MKTLKLIIGSLLLLLTGAVYAQGTPTLAIAPDSLAVYTPAYVRATFPNNVLTQMSDPTQRLKIGRRLSPYEMNRIRVLYAQAVGNTVALDALIYQLPIYYRNQWFAATANSPAAINYSGQRIVPRMKIIGGPSYLLDYTVEMIYLDFRTMPYGSLSPAAAAWETTSVISLNTLAAWGVGWTLGTMINNLIQTYAPDLEDAIGGTIAEVINELQAANQAATAKQLRDAVRNLFGVNKVGPPKVGDARAAMSNANIYYFGYGGTAGTVTVSEGFWPSYDDTGGNAGNSHK